MIFHPDVKRLDVEMAIGGKNFFQDGISLRSLAMSVFFEILGKDFTDRFKCVFSGFLRHIGKFAIKLHNSHVFRTNKNSFLIHPGNFLNSIDFMKVAQQLIQGISIPYIQYDLSFRKAVLYFQVKGFDIQVQLVGNDL